MPGPTHIQLKKGKLTMKTTLENQTVGRRPAREQSVAPEVNIYETQDGYVLQAEMPGVGKSGLEITVEGNELTIVGRRNPEAVEGETIFWERQFGDYRRVFELDPANDTAKIS